MHNLSEFELALKQTKYTGLPLNLDFCLPTVTLYPSSVMENRFVTWNPLIYSICSCLIFLFTSIIFVIYDSKVERRQQVVLATAERTNAVVSSLFPSQVRDQIIHVANNDNNANETNDKNTAGRNDLTICSMRILNQNNL
jgi:hypothetical protein